MIIDTSAVMAVLLREPEETRFLRTMAAAPSRKISAGTWVELGVLLTRRADPALDAIVERFLERFHLIVTPVTPEQADIGRMAYRRFGPNAGIGARLNFGDCFSYALSRATGEPLLFKGNDFTRTDVTPALT